ncbi:MAG: nucleotidyl transferase AbiEii/AbiGii toxin family protein [Chthoniobacterales bacterium]
MEFRSIEVIVRALEEASVRYLIVGGLAVNAHGYSRMTRDVDLVIQLESSNTRRGLEALLRAGYRMMIPEKPEAFADPAMRERWRTEKGMIVLKLWSDEHRRTPIDVFVYEPFDFDREYAAAVWLEISPGLRAPVVSLPALLQMKREAGRPRDLEDINELSRGRETQE